MNRFVRSLAVWSLAVALAAAAPLAAQTWPPDPAVEISVGYYEPTFDTRVRLDSVELGAGTGLDLERDLLVEEEAQELRGEVALRLGQRFHLVVDHVAFERSGSNTLGDSVQFGDAIYAADAVIDAEVSSSHTGAALRFSLLDRPAADVAVSIGASFVDVEASLTGTAEVVVGGQPVGSLTFRETGEASGPVPLAGLHGRFWLSQRLRLAADGRYFDIDDFDGWSGSIVDWGARLDYFLTGSFAVGLGWAGTDIEADFDDGEYLGAIDYAFEGLRAQVTLAF